MDAADAPGIPAEESMEKILKFNSARTQPWMNTRWTHLPLTMVSDGWSPDVDVLAAEQAKDVPRLPPTRAARTPRSRGVFLAEVKKSAAAARKRRLADLLIGALAAAVVAISSALIMGAPSTIMGTALSFNPGPGIVAAASVPPTFMEPHKGR
ncbi:MAG: hypothetical protein ABI537_02825 [Casimicrobiaceae bacterium]